MRCKKLDIYFSIKTTIIVVMVVLPGFLYAKCDTIPKDFRVVFETNISALDSLFCWGDTSFSSGGFRSANNQDFKEELKKQELFNDLDLGAERFYQFLQQLSTKDKQHLIRYFSFYQPVFERDLHKAGLPLDLKYLPPVLSAMNPLAIGENKQAGIWQLMHFQGVLNGLQITRLVDERFNEQLSTKAAVNQLKQNSIVFGSVEYAVIGYLVGNAKLRNTLARCSANPPLSEILKHLPISVTETLAAFQAMTVFLRAHTFQSTGQLLSFDLASVNRQVHFQQISKVLTITEKQLQFLNPQYIYSIIPGDKTVQSIALPGGKRDNFVLWFDSICNSFDSTLFQVVAQNIEYPPAPTRQYVGEKVKDLEIEGKTKIKYTIKSGDVLGFIAEDYNVRVADLKYWNNIYNERRIQVGQKLDIFVDDDKAAYYSNLQKIGKPIKNNSVKVTPFSSPSAMPLYTIPQSARKIEHTVKNGESPYVIAKKYKGVTPEEILVWNGIKDARKIQIGQKLIIYLKEE